MLLFLMLGMMAQTQITDLSQLSNSKVYTLTTPEREYNSAPNGWIVKSDKFQTFKDASVTYNSNSQQQQFAIITVDEGISYYLYSYSAKKFICYGNNVYGELADTPTHPIKFSKQDNGSFVLYFDNSHFLNVGGGGQAAIDGWGPGGTTSGGKADEGNRIVITEVADADLTSALNKFEKRIMTVDQIESDKIYTITCKWEKRGFMYAHQNGNCIDFAGTTESYNYYGGGPWGNYINVTSNPCDIRQQFSIKKIGDKYYLYSICLGKYLADDQIEGGDSRNVLTETPEDPIQIEVDQSGYFSFFFESTKQTICSIPSWYNANKGCMVTYFTEVGTDGADKFKIVDVTNIVADDYDSTPITVKLAEINENNNSMLVDISGYIGTFSAPFDVELPSGVTAYYAKTENVDGFNTITLTSLSNGIPANQGVILVGNASSYMMRPLVSKELESLTDNAFLGTANGKEQMIDGDFVLANKEYGIAFYPAIGTLGTNKAFLRLGNANTSAFRLVVDETTAIENVATEKVDGAIYDLTGRRVLNTVKGGIYIQNGKKFIVK